MATESPAKLRTRLRERYNELKEEPRLTVARLVSEVSEANPDLVEAEKERLYREAMSAWASHKRSAPDRVPS